MFLKVLKWRYKKHGSRIWKDLDGIGFLVVHNVEKWGVDDDVQYAG